MKLIGSIFVISLLAGQIGSIMIMPGIYIYIHDLMLAVVLSIGILSLVRKNKLVTGRLGMPIFLFIISGIISLLANQGKLPFFQIATGSLYLGRWILYVGIYFLIINYRDYSQFWLKILYLTGCLISFIGLLQYLFYPQLQNLQYLGWDPHYYRLFSTLLDPNFASIIIVLTIFLGWYFRKLFPLWLNIFLVLGNILALVLTYSRSGYLSFICGMTLWIYLERKWKMLIFLIIFILIFVFIPKTQLDVTRLDRTVSSIARLDNWQKSYSLIQQSPLFGFGFNTLKFVKQNTLVTDFTQNSRAGSGIDNSFLFVLATSGVFGLAAFFWIIFNIIKIPGQLNKSVSPQITALLYSTGLACGIHSLFNNSLFYAWVMIWLWIVIANSEVISDI
jgi:putative inorganic carbon (hco3(-)) transporter